MSCNSRKSNSSLQLGLLIVDFDGTCTVEDTTSLYYKATTKYRNDLDVKPKDRPRLDELWAQHAEKYMTGYAKSLADSVRNSKHNTTNFDKDGLEVLFQNIATLDVDCTKEVEMSGILKGIDEDGLKWASSQVSLHPGCLVALKHFPSYVRVISTNWSAKLIELVLGGVVSSNHIYANNFPCIGGHSTGLIGKEVKTAFDKKKVVQKLVEHQSSNRVNIFIGDSPVDLLAMLEVDVGILFETCKSTCNIIEAFGIHAKPLSELVIEKKNGFNGRKEQKDEETSLSRTVYKTRSWSEIEQLISSLVP